MIYALDTNIIIHLIEHRTPSVRISRTNAIKRGARFAIPPIVNYEVRRGFMLEPKINHEQAYNFMCSTCITTEITEIVWVRAAIIYSDLKTRGIKVRNKDADILIAAYCIEHGYTLVTANTQDFAPITGLQVENWV